jgi:uncharacterized iron-regulated membrane protein
MSAVPGSLPRRILFWTHLCSGIAAGMVILSLSVTGILLTYEKQVIAAAGHGNRLAPAPGATRLSAERLAAIARAATPQTRRLSLVFDSDPLAPVAVPRGREAPLLLDPYTGELIADSAAGARGFMRGVENWHRWLGGTGTSTRASIVDVSNLLFLFMIASGSYLWLPAVWRWRTVRGLALFKQRYVNSKLRDFSWHHVFSFWMLIPLFLIALSGVVMSFDWANSLVYAAYGESAPQRRGPEGGGGEGARPARDPVAGERAPASLDALLAAAMRQTGDWRRLTVPVATTASTVDIVAEMKSDAIRAPRRTLTLDTRDASLVKMTPAPVPGPGQRARSWLRFVHTGEQYGIVGQTLAGLASIAACFLVYTGLALAFRRLILHS